MKTFLNNNLDVFNKGINVKINNVEKPLQNQNNKKGGLKTKCTPHGIMLKEGEALSN